MQLKKLLRRRRGINPGHSGPGLYPGPTPFVLERTPLPMGVGVYRWPTATDRTCGRDANPGPVADNALS